MKKNILKFLFVSTILFFTNTNTYASTSFSTFTTSTQNAFNGQLISLSWSGLETSGYVLSAICPLGVKLKKEDGSSFACDTEVSTSGQDTDSIGLSLINISGSNKTVTFKIYPKTASGTSLPDLAKTQSVTVTPAVSPISSASVSTTTVTSSLPVTVSWSSSDLDGINIIVDCVDNVSFSSEKDGVSLPCGSPAFTEKQSGSGSVSLYFKNKNDNKSPITLKVLPYIGSGSYDLTHSAPLYFDVSPSKTLAPQIISFGSIGSEVVSGRLINFNWTTANSTGVNLMVDCVESVSFSLSTTSEKLPVCNSFISETSFDPNSSTYITFNNSSHLPKNVYVTLFSKLPNGGFDGVNVKKISIQVDPFGWTPESNYNYKTNSTPTNPSYTPTPTPATQQNPVNKTIKPRKKFLKLLTLGSKGDDVSALQEFLKNNGYYPEGLVTGYMGPATVKAIKRFQEQNGVAKTGQAGYGNFGPATRAKINSL